jgi:hypothetical protein
MSNAAAANPPNPPPTICAFICFLWGVRVSEVFPFPATNSKYDETRLAEQAF